MFAMCPLFSDKQQALTCREAARFQSKSCWPDSYTVHSNKFIICLPELKLLTIFCLLSSLPCFCCLHGILFVRPGPPTNSRVEWFSPFIDFRKWTHYCRSVIFQWVQFQLILKFGRAVHWRQSLKNHKDFKMNILFWQFANTLHLKLQRTQKFQILKIFKNFRPPT